MKKLLAILTVIFTLLSITACGKAQEEVDPSTCNHDYEEVYMTYEYMGECPSCFCVVQGTDEEVLTSVDCKKCGEAKPDWELETEYSGLAKFKCKECDATFVVDISTDQCWTDNTVKTNNVAKEVAE